MIRAFAPGMTMQDPLAQTPSHFDVRQEPTGGEVRLPTSEPFRASEGPEAESEFARLEQLLSSRTRERRDLALELERRGALLRDACTRLSELAPQISESQLVRERDAAVARAVEAEVARADVTFKLDEVLGRLLALGGERPPATATPPMAANEPSLAARLLELEELKQVAEARVVLLEDELGRERERVAATVRERVETVEHFEIEISQTRAGARAQQAELARLRTQLETERAQLVREREALRETTARDREAARQEAQRALDALREQTEHERAGLRSELENDRQALVAQLEAERAELQAHSEREREALQTTTGELTRVRGELHDVRDALVGELDGLRFRLAEAEQALRGNTERLSRVSHQRRELEHRLDSVRAERATEGARAESLARQLQDVPDLDELRAELARERAARATLALQLTAASPQAGDYATQQVRLETLRACLLELRLPLVELESSLNEVARGEGGVGPSVTVDAELLSALEEELRAKDQRIAELETALRERSERDKPQRDAARDVSTLKGELIDVRANATRLSDDLAKERARRRRLAVTVRALQAATESGEAPGPWIEELIAVVNEGTSSLPPKP